MPDDLGRQAVADAHAAVELWFNQVAGNHEHIERDMQMLQLALTVLIRTAESAKKLLEERQSQ